jgi:hypothetical protein
MKGIFFFQPLATVIETNKKILRNETILLLYEIIILQIYY